MNHAQAKEILMLYRPGTRDAEDPELAEAMKLAAQDPELGKWFEQHQAFQLAMRAKFREIEVPQGAKLALLTRHKVIVRPALVFWQRPVWLAAAAIFMILFGLAVFWFKPSVPDRFSQYRENMVSAAVRMYGMDLETKDPEQLRQFIAKKGAPADYDLTHNLAKLQLKGGGLQRWRGNPVSMICFQHGTGGTLFLFVMKRAAVKDPPPASTSQASVAAIDGLMTASWTKGEETYVLAGPSEPGFVEKYVGPHY